MIGLSSSADTQATPLFILTGFLGSGKTTLLARWVRDPAFADTAVIVNEFGEVGLDHMLVTRGEEDDVVLLDSGCLCCTLNSSLSETLTDLFHRRARGEIPSFSRVVVETTGIADPAPLMHTLMTDRLLAARFRLGGVVACVDGLFFMGQKDSYDEVCKQVAVADRLIVTKADVAPAGQIGKIQASVRELNPGAEVLVSSTGDLDPAAALEQIDPDSALALEATAEGQQHDHAGHHGPDIGTVFVPVEQSVDWPGYAALVETFQGRYGADLLRAKGLLRFAGEPRPMVIQGVQHVFALPEAASNVPKDARLGLVLIGRGLEKTEVAKLIENCLGGGDCDAGT